MESKEPESKKVFITSALPYVNNEPHLGNLIGCVLSADFYARYRRNQGDKVMYICGTDEYGTTTELKAFQEGVTCEELCRRYRELHQEIYKYMNISFDYFGKTSTPKQTVITHRIFEALWNKGLIEEHEDEEMYCEKLGQFIADRYLKGFCYHPSCADKKILCNGDQCDGCGGLIDPAKLIEPFCVINGETPYPKKTKHLYLKLDALVDNLKTYSDEVHMTPNAYAITKDWLDRGLRPRCITRDLKWGTSIPKIAGVPDYYDAKVFYVWFDAPIGYLSILDSGVDDPTFWNDGDWVQFMAKDNVPFHTVMFPATLIGADLDYPKMTGLSATEYLTYQGKKFSKSNNFGVFGSDIIKINEYLGIDSDYWRGYLARIRPQTSDASFEWTEFVNFVNGELINNFGNFVNRVWNTLLTNPKYHDFETEPDPESKEFIEEIKTRITEYHQSFADYDLRHAFHCVLQMSHDGNRYFQHRMVWKSIKLTDIESVSHTDSTMATMIWLVSTVGSLIEPFLPTKAYEITSRIKADYDGVKIKYETLNRTKFLLFTKLTLDMLYKCLDNIGIKYLVKA